MTTFGPVMEPVTTLRPGLRRLVAPNPSMMTGPGTNTYLFGHDKVAVLDPGPVIDSHIDTIIETAAAPIGWVLVTHTHPDHSPAASVLAEITGAELVGMPPPEGPHQDATFTPHRTLQDAEEFATGEVTLKAIHTPGHASNHICYLHRESNWLFTGDHVIDGSTVVIDPPDGNMKQYIESLHRVKRLECDALAPGHGEIINDPGRVVDWIIGHRLGREAKVVAALKKNPRLSTYDLVPHVYKDVDKRLYGWAERSLLAHLLKLKEEGLAGQAGELWTALRE